MAKCQKQGRVRLVASLCCLGDRRNYFSKETLAGYKAFMYPVGVGNVLSNKSSNRRGKPSGDRMEHDNTKTVVPQGLVYCTDDI